MEKAALISRVEDLEKAEGHDRLYFGVEFCEIKIPTAEEAKQAYKFAKSNNMGFTLVTPYVTDVGLATVERVLETMPTDGSIEVVANDFGVLRVIMRRDADFIPVFGRLLTKQKRGFGISSHQADAGPALAEHWRSSGADNDAVRAFLVGLGVHRVELDNLLQGISSCFPDPGFSGSVYYPYGYVTTTRYCPWAFDGSTWPNMRGRCGRPCLRGMIEETGDVFTTKLYLSGNAQFYKNMALPPEEELLVKGINRIVYEPAIPV